MTIQVNQHWMSDSWDEHWCIEKIGPKTVTVIISPIISSKRTIETRRFDHDQINAFLQAGKFDLID